MSKKVTPEDNAANIQNPNKGNSGVNKQNAKNEGNRGKQMNPNQSSSKKK